VLAGQFDHLRIIMLPQRFGRHGVAGTKQR
jgi:hypothetical protein